jgi:hypothetical protein
LGATLANILCGAEEGIFRFFWLLLLLSPLS